MKSTLARMSVRQRRLATLAVFTAAIMGAIWLFSGNDEAGVSSIEKSAEYQDPALLARAWALPVAALYRKGGFDFQRNQSFCGPTSAVNVLRSLGKSASQDRIIDDTGITTFLGFVPMGLTLEDEAALLRRKTGLRVDMMRDLSLEAFRQQLVRTNDPALRFVINFTRRTLFARGGGHHSPILGYLADRDLVFLGDVNRRYQPWLVKPERLYEAMNTRDSATGHTRGLLVVHVHETR